MVERGRSCEVRSYQFCDIHPFGRVPQLQAIGGRGSRRTSCAPLFELPAAVLSAHPALRVSGLSRSARTGTFIPHLCSTSCFAPFGLPTAALCAHPCTTSRLKPSGSFVTPAPKTSRCFDFCPSSPIVRSPSVLSLRRAHPEMVSE